MSAHRWLQRFLMVAAGGMSIAAAGAPQTIFFNGNIYALDAAAPRAEALAIADGRLIAVGSNADVTLLAGAEGKSVDLEGATVLPGLIDAHGHLLSLGSMGLGKLDLSQTRSFDDVLARISERVRIAKSGEWILGRGWDHESWPERRLPDHARLSAISPHNPVWLQRVDGHMGLANAAAMAQAGIRRDTLSPAGGEIQHDAAGEPSGIFVDAAMSLIRGAAEDGRGTAELLLKAQQMCLSAGLTGVHDPGISPSEAAVYRQLADDGSLKLRVYAMIHADDAPAFFAKHGLTISERLTVRACKAYMDGALGSRGAWLQRPYADRAVDEAGRPYAGLQLTPTAAFRELVQDAVKHGYQVCTHCIGDQANRTVLDAYESVLKELGPSGTPASARINPRFRIEHAQVLHPADIPRFKLLGIIPSMQPTHCTSDMRWVEQRIGIDRARGSYAWSSLLKSGAQIAAGSDFPVESHNPFLGIYAAITRQDVEGHPPGGWMPEERMSREQALRAFTLDAAYAAFEEKEKGSLAVGKLADFIVLDRDVMSCAPREIPATRVLRTVIGGETVYEAAPTSAPRP